MLILTIKPGEAVYLSGTGECKLLVLSNDRGCVRMGFEAPQSITILREKVKLRQEQASQPHQPQHD